MKYLYEINENGCVGDELGKLNYNFLMLETQVCQLSTKFFSGDKSYASSFSQLSNIVNKLNEVSNIYNNPVSHKQCYNATNLLSSYWCKNDISIIYPIDYTNPKAFFYVDSDINVLKQTGLDFVKTKFVSAPLLDESTVTVNFIKISNKGTFTQLSSSKNLVNLSKEDMHLNDIQKIRYIKVNNQWVAE